MTYWLFFTTTFISAFLTFFIQPVLAKKLLPHFGGSAFVWIASVLFFQVGLLLGYGYACLLTKKIAPRFQALLHGVLLLGSVCYLGLSDYSFSSMHEWYPPLAIFLLLSKTILYPYALLTTTSPLLQHWYVCLTNSDFPHRYYAVSNAGSLLGLLSYPFLFEIFLPITRQLNIWDIGYGIFALTSLAIISLLYRKNPANIQLTRMHSLLIQPIFTWVLLSFLSCTLLLAGTFYISQNIINLPLIWVIPLALYLISFIITFSKPKGYDPQFWLQIFVVWLILFSYLIFSHEVNNIDFLLILLLLMFSGMMILHGELIRHKPENANLTIFYFFLALGGALGGVFVNFFAPFLFDGWWDLYLPLFILLGICIFKFTQLYLNKKSRWNLGLLGLTFLCLPWFIYVMYAQNFAHNKNILLTKRSLYGFIQITEHTKPEDLAHRKLHHNSIVHGIQFLAPAKKHLPTSYYGSRSGVAAAIQYLHQKRNRPLKIGVVGLGTGSIAALTYPGDFMKFYEIDPKMIQISLEYFTFLQDKQENIKIEEGDGRINLAKDKAVYDLIVIDAFSGDSIPFHLITIEALEIYLNHLEPEGLIAFHITNTYVNIAPVTMGLANQKGLEHSWIYSGNQVAQGIFQADWVILSPLRTFSIWAKKQPYRIQNNPTKVQFWTDNYNSLTPLLRPYIE